MDEQFLSPYYEERKEKRDENFFAELYRGAWMLTFSDLLMLLLCVFVFRLAMSALPHEKILSKISIGTHNIDRHAPNSPPDTKVYWQNALGSHSDKIDALLGTLTRTLGLTPLEIDPNRKSFSGKIIITATDGLLIASLPDTAFPLGGDELSFSASENIRTIGKTFNEPTFNIRIESMAEIRENASGLFTSDWELSTARAMAVLRQFLDAGVDAQRLSVGSYGNSTRSISGFKEQNSSQNNFVNLIISLQK